ncbi:CapA family protein [Haloglomus litoreum]|uniref:CapA family protein n=1 Tax=Haloglomus litoreum TaxID=3034026 RepID=UPI0023E757DF|nr:CapA family protein [Haloglomus sp. DT116]
MDRRLSRRALLRGAAVGATAGLAGCGYFEGVGGPERRRTATYQGRVTDLEGAPVADATVAALVGGSEPLATTTTDASGTFELSAGGAPVWVRVRHPDYVTETRAVGPNRTHRLPLTPDEGTVSMAFGGDVMFGRRFYAASDDPLEPQARLRPNARLADHRAVLRHVAPLFDAVDLGSVNLETPLTESTWRHPSKEFAFTSHPVAAEALADAGVDYTSLGNNHTFDALRPGLRDTLEAVSDAGLAHSGAGLSADDAWATATLERGDTTVAVVSCTTVTGERYDIDWSADATGRGPYTVTQGGRSLTFGDGIGAAGASEERITRAVESAREAADLVVVQVHGDTEYVRTPTDRMVRMVDAATRAGADLVVNHHPHVTGGLERRNGALVAWTLGNLVFDQELWETLRSYALVVHATDDGVLRAYTQPLVLDGYVPTPATGSLARGLTRETAGLSTDAAALASDGRRLEVGTPDLTGGGSRRTQRVEADGAIYTRTGGWVTDVSDRSGTVLLGRDRVFAGTFDNETVDGDGVGGALWRFSRDQVGWRVGYGSSGGVRLTAYPEDTRRSVLSPAARIPVDDRPLALTGRYRYGGDGGLSLLVSWYNAAEGISVQRRTVDLPATDDEWRLVTESLDPPANATYVNLFVYLDPSDDGARRAVVDDLRLVEWAPPETTGGREFDHLLVDGAATLELNGVGSSPSEWVRLSEQ